MVPGPVKGGARGVGVSEYPAIADEDINRAVGAAAVGSDVEKRIVVGGHSLREDAVIGVVDGAVSLDPHRDAKVGKIGEAQAARASRILDVSVSAGHPIKGYRLACAQGSGEGGVIGGAAYQSAVVAIAGGILEVAIERIVADKAGLRGKESCTGEEGRGEEGSWAHQIFVDSWLSKRFILRVTRKMWGLGCSHRFG